jgi:glutamyl-tRNA synthetase
MISYTDKVLGKIEKPLYELDDWVLLRPDGVPTYNFACVVDDYYMKITLAIRGQEHINSTIPQINLWQTLGWEPCEYAHLPLIMAEDGAKLSKRKHNEADVMNHKKNGILKEALLNYVCKLGWGHGNEEVFSREQMEGWFSMDGVGHASAKWDEKKLLWVNQEWLKKLDPAVVADRLEPFLTTSTSKGQRVKLVVALRERASTLKELAHKAETLFLKQALPEIDPKAAKEYLDDTGKCVLMAIEATLKGTANAMWSKPDELNAAFMKVVNEKAGISDVDNKKTQKSKLAKASQPLRVALTGTTVSPGMGETLELIGKEQTLQRIAAALKVAV